MNDIKLLGNLVAAPELKTSKRERGYSHFSVAVPRHDDKHKADFVSCVCFDKLAAALAEHCIKGQRVLVSGRLEVTKMLDPKTQLAKVYYTVVAERIDFLQRPNVAVGQ